MEVLPDLIEVNIVAKLPERGEPTMESFIVNFTRSATGTTDALESGGQEESG